MAKAKAAEVKSEEAGTDRAKAAELKPGLSKTLRQAGLDDVGELQAPRAHRINRKANTFGDEAKGAGWGSTPTHSWWAGEGVAGQFRRV